MDTLRKIWSEGDGKRERESYTDTHTHALYIDSYIYIYTYIYVYVYVCVYVYVYVYVYINAYAQYPQNIQVSFSQIFGSMDATRVQPCDPCLQGNARKGVKKSLEVDVVIGADGANSRVAKDIEAGDYEYAIAFQATAWRAMAPLKRVDRMVTCFWGC